MRALPLLLALAVAAPLVAQDRTPAPPGTYPLLEFARQREADRLQEAREDEKYAPPAGFEYLNLKQALHARDQAHVPPDEQCAGSVGAARFAELHVDVGTARAIDGDYPGAAAEYRRALACQPRNADILDALGGVLFDARDLQGARAANDESLALDPRSVSSNRLAGNLDYVEERWADAIARFRYVAASDGDRVRAGYGQLMFWLAQLRGGITHPEFVARMPGEGWPQPLLLYMRGEYTEAELIERIDEGDSPEDFAVFYRTHAQSRVLEDELRRYGLGCRIVGGVAFYERAFGFKMRFNADDWDYAELETGDTTLAFAAEKMADLLGTSITPNRADATAAGIELAFVTDEVQSAFARAIDAGATRVTEPNQTPWGQTVSYVLDQNGVLIEICSPVSG